MKFVLNSTTKTGPRLGHIITETDTHVQSTLATPCCFLYTRKGSVPHLTKDVLARVCTKALPVHLNAATMFSAYDASKKYQKGVANFVGYDNHSTYFSLHDTAARTKSGYNSKDSSSLWDTTGKKRVDVMKYVVMLDAFQPDWFQALCDSDTTYASTKKRIRKAVDRSLSHLDLCLKHCSELESLKNSQIFGTIEGGYDLQERIRSSKETASRPVAGFVLDGFISHESDSEVHFDEILQIVSEVLKELPQEKPRIMHGPWDPYEMLELIERGIDVTDLSYVYNVTEQGIGLTFDYSESTLSDEIVTKHANKASKHFSYGINLHEQKFSDEFAPVLDGCQCYCCQNYSRAYVNHLLTSSELLAQVLLTMHNLYHYLNFMESIPNAIRNNKFENVKLAVLRSRVETNAVLQDEHVL